MRMHNSSLLFRDTFELEMEKQCSAKRSFADDCITYSDLDKSSWVNGREEKNKLLSRGFQKGAEPAFCGTGAKFKGADCFVLLGSVFCNLSYKVISTSDYTMMVR